jgi:hypothetical protein
VATPGPDMSNPVIDSIPLLPKSAPRADALLMVESTGTAAAPLVNAAGPASAAVPQTASRMDRTFHGRY